MAEDISVSAEVYPSEPDTLETTPTGGDADEYTAAFFSTPVLHGPSVFEVAHLWADTLVSTRHIGETESVTVGAQTGNMFEVEDPAIVSPSFALVENVSGARTLQFSAEMTGWLLVGDVVYSLEEAVNEGLVRQGRHGAGSYMIRVTAETRARVDVGRHTFLIRTTDRTAMPALRLRLDRGLIAFGSVSAALHVLVVLLAFFVPPPSKTFALGEVTTEDRFMSALIVPERPIDDPDDKPELTGEDGGEVAEGDAVQAGTEESADTDRRVAIRGDASRITLKKDSREVASSSGALAVLNNSSITAAWIDGVTTEGFDALTAMGGVKGERTGEDYGHGGFALFGVGEKRGGGGVRTSFTTGFDTVSRPTNGGTADFGHDAGKLAPKKERAPSVVFKQPTVSDGLDRELIQRTVRKHHKEVKYCYEQELIKNKNLAGKMTVRFTITANGDVAAAIPESSTLANSAVERCVANKIRRWAFPSVKGGGIVVVNYPFVFAPH